MFNGKKTIIELLILLISNLNNMGFNMRNYAKEKRINVYARSLCVGILLFVLILTTLLPASAEIAKAWDYDEDSISQNEVDSSNNFSSPTDLERDKGSQKNSNINSFRKSNSSQDALVAGIYDDVSYNWNNVNNDATVLKEDTDLRTEKTKSYLMSDGSYTTVYYDKPVHYITNGKYYEIDNSLVQQKPGEYTNRSNGFSASFSNGVEGFPQIALSLEKYLLSFSMGYKSDDNTFITDIDFKNDGISLTNEQRILDFQASKQELKHAFNNDTVVFYKMLSNGIKEDIVLNATQSNYEYLFSLEVNDLKLILNDSGEIEAQNDLGNVVFLIPKAFMYDAKGSYSKNVTYDLREVNGQYFIKMEADDEWINNPSRRFPITIDPNIIIPNIDNKISIGSRSSISESGTELKNNNEFFIKVNDLNLPSNATIIDARLAVQIKSDLNKDCLIDVLDCNQAWANGTETNNVSTSFYFDNGVDVTPNSQFLVNSGTNNYYLDITQEAKNWFEFGRDNNGIALRVSPGYLNDSEKVFVQKGTIDGYSAPVLSVNYRQCIGLESYWDYSITSSTNDVLYVNNYNLQYIVVHSDAETGGDLPIQLSHIYLKSLVNVSSNDLQSYFTTKFQNMKLGKGWRFNYQQLVVTIQNKKVYFDGDGTCHMFDQQQDNLWTDEDGLGLSLSITDNNSYVIKAKDKSEMLFDSNGYLIRITDKNSNSININYSNNRITSIADTSQRSITLLYDEDGYLKEIRYRDVNLRVKATKYSYDKTGDLLTAITEEDLTQSLYSYNTANELSMIKSGYKNKKIHSQDIVSGIRITKLTRDVLYEGEELQSVQDEKFYETYNGLMIENGLFKDDVLVQPYDRFDVWALKNSSMIIQATSGNSFVEYYAYSFTNDEYILKTLWNKYINCNEKIINAYDTAGRVVSSYIVSPEPGVSIIQEYDENNNKIEAQMKFENNNVNRLQNGSFENGLSNWTSQSSGDSVYKNLEVTDRCVYYGSKSLELFVAQPVNVDFRAVQEIVLGKGEYVLSGYIKVQDVLLPAEYGEYGAYLGVQIETNRIRTMYVNQDMFENRNGFRYVSVSFSISSVQTVKVMAGIKNAAGFAYVDAVQVVRSDYGEAEKYNLIENGGFENANNNSETLNMDNWITSYPERLSIVHQNDNISEDQMNSQYKFAFSGNTLKIAGKIDECINIFQNVSISNIDHDTYFTLTAWINGFGKLTWPKETSNIGIEFYVKYTNGEQEYHRMRFSNSASTWHQAAYGFTVKPGVSNIEVYLQVRETTAIVYLDNISLVESKTILMDYDSNGTNTAYVDSEGKRYTYDEDGNKIDISQDSIEKFTCIKDENGNVLSTTDRTKNIKTEFSYNDKGQVISETIASLSGNKTITTKTGYSRILANFESVITSEDALGFKTVSNYDLFTDTLKRTTFNDGSYIEYSFVNGAWTKPNNDTDYGSDIPVYELKDVIVSRYNKSGKLIDKVIYTYYMTYGESRSTFFNYTGDMYYYYPDKMLKSITLDNGTIYKYKYTPFGDIDSVYVTKVDGEPADKSIIVKYGYDSRTNKLISKEMANDYQEVYVYDKAGRISQVRTRANDVLLYEWRYSASGNIISLKDHKNDIFYEYEYDTNGRQILEVRGSLLTNCIDTYIETVYDGYGNILRTNVYDSAKFNVPIFEQSTSSFSLDAMTRERTGDTERIKVGTKTKIIYTYASENSNTIIKEDNMFVRMSSLSSGIVKTFERNSSGVLTSVVLTARTASSNPDTINCGVNGVTLYDYEYDSDNGMVGGQRVANGADIRYTFDDLGRETGSLISTAKINGTRILQDVYQYLDGDNNATSYSLRAKTVSFGNNSILYGQNFCFEDSSLGNDATKRTNPYNVWQLLENNVVKVNYYYDDLGRLAREDNAYINKTIVYAYDSNGNILSKTRYAFTLGDLTGENGTTITYVYQDDLHKDRLTSYNGQVITYDKVGNPLTYRGSTMSWTGRRLSSYTNGSLSIDYTYDVSDIRLSKTVNGTKTTYLYSGTDLLREKSGSNTIWYLYDNVGMIGLQINGESYYYVRNMQGDVNSIIDENGEVVVNYVYDTWGKVISVSGTLADTVGEQNPIRYRGYYYDTETGLYYLNSRYYDPETGRFISADVQAENGNLYAYCQNDPVNLTDESGYLSKLWKRIIKIAIGVVATVAAVAITVATGGAALPVVGGVIASTLISGGIAAGVTALQGGSKEDILEAGIDGLCDGLMWGGIFALGGSIINACGARVYNAAKSGGEIGSASKSAEIISSTNQAPAKITGYTKHGLQSAFSHNGHGVGTKYINSAVKNPNTIIYDPARDTFKFVGKDAVTVLNRSGKVVTTYPLSETAYRFKIIIG